MADSQSKQSERVGLPKSGEGLKSVIVRMQLEGETPDTPIPLLPEGMKQVAATIPPRFVEVRKAFMQAQTLSAVTAREVIVGICDPSGSLAVVGALRGEDAANTFAKSMIDLGFTFKQGGVPERMQGCDVLMSYDPPRG